MEASFSNLIQVNSTRLAFSNVAIKKRFSIQFRFFIELFNLKTTKIHRKLEIRNILTFQHLQNLLQVVRHLMVFENLLKKIAAFFPKLIVKLDGTNHEAQLKSKFLASLRRVQVHTYTVHIMHACSYY